MRWSQAGAGTVCGVTYCVLYVVGFRLAFEWASTLFCPTQNRTESPLFVVSPQRGVIVEYCDGVVVSFASVTASIKYYFMEWS